MVDNPFDIIADSLPVEVGQGTYVKWSRYDLYDADGYSHHIEFRKLGSSKRNEVITANFVNSVCEFTFDISAGSYRWFLYTVRTSDGARILSDTGTIKVIADADTIADLRSHNEIMVDKIRAVLEGRLDSDVASYTIAGRQINKIPLTELREFLTIYESALAAEKKTVGGNSNSLIIGFK